MFAVEIKGLGAAMEALRRVPKAQRGVAGIFIAGERNANLAQYHHDGTENLDGSVRMPARNVFHVPVGKAREIVGVLKRGIEDVLRGRSSGMMQAMSDVGKLTAQQFQTNIDGGKVAGNARIAPLSKPYKKWKDAKFGKQPILVATGQFYRAIRSRVTRES